MARTMEQLLAGNKHENRVDKLLKLAENISTEELINYKLIKKQQSIKLKDSYQEN